MVAEGAGMVRRVGQVVAGGPLELPPVSRRLGRREGQGVLNPPATQDSGRS